MRYITATIGAVFIFTAIVVISVFISHFLPASLQDNVTVDLGFFQLRGTPELLVGVALAGTAAVHSFRSTLERHQVKVDPNSRTEN